MWALIDRLAHDPEDADTDLQWRTEPTPRAWTTDDPDLPSGTVRSLAFIAAAHYAKRLPDRADARELIRAGLDADQNPSLDVRAAIAGQLGMITASDPAWAQELIEPMLLDTPDELADVAWAAQLDHRPADIVVMRLLSTTGAYRFAVDYVAGRERFSKTRRKQLGTQIIGAALFEAETADETLSAWFTREDGEIRAGSVKAVGDALARPKCCPSTTKRCRWCGASGWASCPPTIRSWPHTQAGRSPSATISSGLSCWSLTLRKNGGKLISPQSVFDWAAEAAHAASLDVIEMIDLVSTGSDTIQMVWNRHRLNVVIEHLARFELPEVADALGRLLERLNERGFGDLRPDRGD